MMCCSALQFNSSDYLIDVLQIYEKNTDVKNYFLIVLKIVETKSLFDVLKITNILYLLNLVIY